MVARSVTRRLPAHSCVTAAAIWVPTAAKSADTATSVVSASNAVGGEYWPDGSEISLRFSLAMALPGSTWTPREST